jgi:spermidine/putrescine ABC transporter ATP-binding subunit
LTRATDQQALAINGVTHRYGRVAVLSDIELEIADGGFVTLLGPSGCGKTTLLRIIAGFVRPSEGRVLLHGRDITRVPAHKRPVNMVFQRSTLFPHLDVFDNVAFGLRIAKVPKDEVTKRVADSLALVRLEGFENRRAHELSGGQVQRIALARALVNRPQVLLLDEPLSALDLKVKLEMEEELRRVHRQTGATFIYVTHDQREALALADRVVVFNQGHIEQIGTPDEIYRSPATRFAARFVGDANVIPVEIRTRTAGEATVDIVGRDVPVPCGNDTVTGPAWLVLRPEAVRLDAAPAATPASLRGVVSDRAFRGSTFTYLVQIDGLPEAVKAEMPAETGGDLPPGTGVAVSWDPASCGLLERAPGDV